MRPIYQNRSLRVFVSSTFADMFEDRKVLEEKVFPHIRRLCQTRSVEFMAVNLFWGVPDETKLEQALEICLIEVKNCHPYFLGFLGQRYGGIQKREKYQNLANRYDEFEWLKDYPESSVTELEIYHALFREQCDKNLNQTMHFYFRDPKYADNKRNDLFAETDPIKKERLEQLKQQIREKNLPITDYQKPTDLSDLVFEHLKTVVDELFPESEIPTELERTRSSHDGFAYSRQWVYLKRETDFQRLDQHFIETNLPLVIVGESGSGKTSLLANWAFQLQEKTPNTFIIWHFIGSSAESTNLDHLLRRLFEELKSRFPSFYTQENLPTSTEELIKQLPLWLANVPEKIVLILDGLNQLEQEAQKLLWLPTFIPEKVRLYLSTLTDHSQFEILQQRKDWQSFEIALLNAQERDLIVKSILQRELGGKDLHSDHLKLIQKQPQTLNPLYLKVLLKEMQVVGKHEELEQQLKHYLAAETISDLYIKVLQRFEESYGKESICNAMRLIWISRRGLSEHELLEILNIPQYEWLIISAAFDQILALVNRNGLLNFYHSYLQQAVEQHYLNNEDLKKAAHRDLAMYFKTQPLDERIANELPHHLFEAQHWEELKTCISSAPLMSLHNNEYELLKYWRQISDYEDMEKVYYQDRVNLLRKTHFSQRLEMYADDWMLANLLEKAGRYSQVTTILRRQILKVNQKRFGKQSEETANSLNNLANLYLNQGKYEEALPLYLRALEIWENVLGKEHPNVATSLNNLAILYYSQGKYEEALPLYLRALEIFEKVLGKEHPDVAQSLNNLAYLYNSQGKYEEALPLYLRALEIKEKVLGKEHPHVATSLNDLALLYANQGKYEEALPLYLRALEIGEKMLGKEHPNVATSLNNLANLYANQGKYEEALALHLRALEIREKVLGTEHPDVATSLNNLAILYYSQGKYEEALPLFEESLKIYKEVLGTQHPYYAISLGNLAGIYEQSGNYEKALPLREQALKIHKEVLGTQHPYYATSLNNLALLYKTMGKPEQALPLYEESLKIVRKILGEEHPDTKLYKENYESCLAASKNLEKPDRFSKPVRFKNETTKINRNDPCPCGSGKKYKHCHGKFS